MKLKKIIVFISIFFIFVLAGNFNFLNCFAENDYLATIQHTRRVSNGQVQDVFCVELNKNNLHLEKFNEVSVELNKDFRAYLSKYNHWLNNFEPNGKEVTPEIYENIKSSISIIYSNESSGKFYLEKTFKSSSYLYLFYGKTGIKGINDGKPFKPISKDVGPFLIDETKLPKENSSIFSYEYGGIKSNSILKNIIELQNFDGSGLYLDKYIEMFSGKYTKEQLISKIQFLQAFGSDKPKLFSNSNDGKRVKEVDGLYYHYWDLNNLSTENANEIEVFFKAPISATWYILGLSLALIAVIITLIVSKGIVLKEINSALTLDYKNKDEDN